MPHKQKENHDHSTKSKKERLKAKNETVARKQCLTSARLAAELEAAGLVPNNVPLVEGRGSYEIGCEPEREYKFNSKKRSKKHLRKDMRKNILRAEREEEERKKQEQEERWRQEHGQESSSEEEEELIEEYIVYVCECCEKKFATTNQFVNHSNSKKHRDNAAVYEEAGVIVTGVELRGMNEEELFDDEDSRVEVEEADDEIEEEEEEEEEEEDYEEEEEAKPSLFASFLNDDSSSSSSSSSEEEETFVPPLPPVVLLKDDKEIDIDLELTLDEVICQNKVLQSELNVNKLNGTVAVLPPPPEPLPFDDNYDPQDYSINENRLAGVQNRLQKRLAARGIQPTQIESYASNAISMGKTLLQQVMEANIDTLQTKLEAYNKHKRECHLLGREFAQAKGNSKALPAQYSRKQDTADDTKKRANIHHAGSHYHMQAARSMQYGRTQGLMARHSSQGSRLQASRMAAKETARMQTGGGTKVGKTSKKSNQKRQGEAGGSKKAGGHKGAAEN